MTRRYLIASYALLLSACASAPQPFCIPPELTRSPEAAGPFGTPVPRSLNDAEEYDRCKRQEARMRLEAERREAEGRAGQPETEPGARLREEAERARQREAEQLERERRETKGPGEAPVE